MAMLQKGAWTEVHRFGSIKWYADVTSSPDALATSLAPYTPAECKLPERGLLCCYRARAPLALLEGCGETCSVEQCGSHLSGLVSACVYSYERWQVKVKCVRTVFLLYTYIYIYMYTHIYSSLVT